MSTGHQVPGSLLSTITSIKAHNKFLSISSVCSSINRNSLFQNAFGRDLNLHSRIPSWNLGSVCSWSRLIPRIPAPLTSASTQSIRGEPWSFASGKRGQLAMILTGRTLIITLNISSLSLEMLSDKLLPTSLSSRDWGVLNMNKQREYLLLGTTAVCVRKISIYEMNRLLKLWSFSFFASHKVSLLLF